jgi:Leucine-rich repeat (LRR) protein
MPDFDNLEIDFSNNNIVQNIVKHDFFSRITKVNLANNSLVDLDFQIFDSRNLRTLNLLNNPIKTLRKSIQNLYICAVLIGNITMKCDCDMAWLKPWLLKQEFAKCGFKNIITCETKDGIINAMSINRNDLCSSKVNNVTWGYILLLAATLVLVLWYITVKYRFECFIFSRKIITVPLD